MQQEEDHQLTSMLDADDEEDDCDDNTTLLAMFEFYKQIVLMSGALISASLMMRNPCTKIQKL
jgi:hypothetical protein